MNCPACRREPLVVLELEQIEVDYCFRCHGVWLDSGELELLFGDAEACSRFLSIGRPREPVPSEPRRRCPICRRKMSKETTEADPPVVFDHCGRGDGLWLDQGELDTVLSHPDSLPEGREVVELLRRMFRDDGRRIAGSREL